MKDLRLNYKRELHWGMVYKDNNRGVDEEKYILHA